MLLEIHIELPRLYLTYSGQISLLSTNTYMDTIILQVFAYC